MTTDDFGSFTTHILANTPAATPAKAFDPYLGDYLYMMTDGNSFYGIFSANNTPDTNNFPSGVAYQRNADFATRTLLNLDHKTPVPVSIDPFVFTVSDTPDNVIAGIVTDINTISLDDVSILIKTAAGSTLQLSTDSTGRYISPILPPGLYDVSATRDDFLPAEAAVTVLDAVSLTMQNFVLLKALPFTLTGLVTDTTGVPIDGRTVSVAGFTAHTDASGHYAFNDINPGPSSGLFDVEVSAPGFVSASLTLTIPNGATVVSDFVLKKKGILTGHVTDSGGVSLGGASVSLGIPHTFTDLTGLYSFVLDPGQYAEAVTLRGFRPGMASVTIPIGGTVVRDFTLDRAVPGTITGTVTDDGGSPLVNASVAIAGSTVTKTDVNGRYTLANLIPGSYSIRASRGAQFIPETRTVAVLDGQTLDLDFVLVSRSGN